MRVELAVGIWERQVACFSPSPSILTNTLLCHLYSSQKSLDSLSFFFWLWLVLPVSWAVAHVCQNAIFSLCDQDQTFPYLVYYWIFKEKYRLARARFISLPRTQSQLFSRDAWRSYQSFLYVASRDILWEDKGVSTQGGIQESINEYFGIRWLCLSTELRY